MPLMTRDSTREKAIISLYLSCSSAVEIAKKFCISKQRVHQILKRNNINKSHQPKLFTSKDISILLCSRNKKERWVSRLEKVRGCDQETFDQINKNIGKDGLTPSEVYQKNLSNAKTRGISWEFNFYSWWKKWEDSGKWAYRGRGVDRFCMARWGDEGPYSPENTRIDLFAQNSSEGRSGKHKQKQE